MSISTGPAGPQEPGDPSSRWPWMALGLGLLVLVVIGGFYLFANRSQPVAVNVIGTPTAVTAAPVPTPIAQPTPPPVIITVVVTATPLPAPITPTLTASSPPAPTAPPAATTAPPIVAAQPTLATAAQPTLAPTTPPTVATPPTAAAPPSPTPFAGQVASAGGLGNTRADVDAAYGAPTGQTPAHLVVYRKTTFEYDVEFVPDLNGRAAMLKAVPQTGAPPLTLEAATREAHTLLPKDAQPPSAQQEGNDQYVIERYVSQSLVQALPAQTFATNKAQPGQFVVVYVRDTSQAGRISRIIIGPGSDAAALIGVS